MNTEPFPDERSRLAALDASGLVDTASEAVFDEPVELVTKICSAPYGFLSLVGEQRLWLKARVGIAEQEMPREHAFCGQTILSNEMFIVADARADPRFGRNPLVAGEAQVRFYGGVPVWSPEGLPLGSLCVLDTVPRLLTPDQKNALTVLSRQISSEIALRVEKQRLARVLTERNRLQQEVRASSALVRAFVDQSPLASSLEDQHGVLVYYNRAFKDRFNLGGESWIGRKREELRAVQGRAVGALLQSMGLKVAEEVAPGADSSPACWRSYRVSLLNDAGDPLEAVISLEVTRERVAEMALEEANRRLVAANQPLVNLELIDPVTGLSNRRAFEERLAQSLKTAARHANPAAMILVEVDGFENFVSMLGRAEGDRALRRIARLLQEGARGTDLSCRYEGEQLAVLLPNTTVEQAVALAERLRLLVRESNPEVGRITLSAGVGDNGVKGPGSSRAGQRPALHARGGQANPEGRGPLPDGRPEQAQDLSLPEKALLALQRAKVLGGDQVAVYEDSLCLATSEPA